MFKLTERNPSGVYLERFFLMTVLLIPAAYLKGSRVITVAAASVLSCMLADAVCCLIRRIKYDAKDYAVPFWGLACAMMMPVNISAGMIILSSLVCIVVGKHLFGGSDNIVFCPPAISTAFLIICYPADMLYFPRHGEKIAAFTSFDGTLARGLEYSLNLENIPSQSLSDIVMGFIPGSIAAVYTVVILICGICMMFRRSNSAAACGACLLTAGILAFAFPRPEVDRFTSVVYELSSGYLMFGTVFLAAEPYRCPKSIAGKIFYGIMLGYTTMMFRIFGKTEGAFLFALLVTCALENAFDRVVENVIYWKKTYLNTFEKSKEQIQTGTVKLTDTQEIELPEKFKYNTPPIDNKIKKLKRSRKNDKIPDKISDDKITENPAENAETQADGTAAEKEADDNEE